MGRNGSSIAHNGRRDISLLRCEWDAQSDQEFILGNGNQMEFTCMGSDVAHPGGSNSGISKATVEGPVNGNVGGVEAWMGACTRNDGDSNMDYEIGNHEHNSESKKDECKLLAKNCEGRTEARTRGIREHSAARVGREIEEIRVAVKS